MKVLKFGGSSVATPARIKEVIAIVKGQYDPGRAALVFSAFGGVTDQLIGMSRRAVTGDENYRADLPAFEKRHLDAVRELVDVKKQAAVLADVKSTLNELEGVLQGVWLVRELSDRTLDFIMSFGERLSNFIIAHAFSQAGIKAEYMDARRLIRTDNQFGNARVDFNATNRQIAAHFKNCEALQIITGFIAATENNETTTLGRSGSDYTAAIIAAGVKASVLEIWTDVDGMLTADPRKVKKAFPVREMTYEEAMELSHFGAKVIFPATMQPAMSLNIPILIKNTFHPAGNGTLISASPASNGYIIKGISSIGDVCLLRVQGSGMVGVVGVSMRLFGALARGNVNVILISQASSEHSICFAVESGSAAKAKMLLEREFDLEIRAGQVDEVAVECDMAIVAVVGESLRKNAVAPGRLFQALGRNGVNITAIAQGSSERNISVVINSRDEAKALNALHEAFFLSDVKTLHLFLVGTGLVGGTLLDIIRDQQECLAKDHRLAVNVIAVANSRRMIISPDGLKLKNWKNALKEDGEEMEMRKLLDRIRSLNLPNSVFIDATASEEIIPWYEEILKANVSIVTPNKKANSGSLEQYRRLKELSQQHGVRFLYETNVGAGLPVINTLNDLIYSGDKLLRIEAVLSGTLNFLFSSFREGMKFSDLVKEAKEKGFTEPDPRDDLRGMDVARKILILAREAGAQLEPSDVTVESLVPPACEKAPDVKAFFGELEKSNSYFEDKLQKALKEGKKLRYIAAFENGKVQVGLQGVDETHPFYPLAGNENIISFTTERYNERPLVVKGPGAGAEVTAAGVFADIIRISN